MYTALSASSRTLSEFLQARLRAIPDLAVFDKPTTALLNNPAEMQEGLSVWLYRIVRDEQRLNAPPQRIGPNSLRRTPLPFRLHYLITPMVNGGDGIASHETEQKILGRVLQALYDHPIIHGSDLWKELAGTDVELNTRLEPMTLEEITRVWDALNRPYKLSVSYEVSVVYIESGMQAEHIGQVEVVMPEYGVVVSSEQS